MSRRRPAEHDMDYDQDPQGPVESQADGDPRAGDPGSDDAFARGATADAGLVDERPTSAKSTGAAGGAPETLPVDDGAVTADALAEQRDKYLRLAAEYENYRKRAIRERNEAGVRAQADLVKQLIDALDDLARFA